MSGRPVPGSLITIPSTSTESVLVELESLLELQACFMIFHIFLGLSLFLEEICLL